MTGIAQSISGDAACPILYSFRRCPYAMRARMAIAASGTVCEIREVSLKAKPEAMIVASPKATVPVMVLPCGQVVDESLDIMLWVLERNDPLSWLMPQAEDLTAMLALIETSDGPFKNNLDRYKYATHYADSDPIDDRAQGVMFLTELNGRLAGSDHLFGNRPALADFAIFPFVRQFANTDRSWFDKLELPALQAWLEQHLSSDLFEAIMPKRKFWQP